jgi:predicted nucleotide-binding protein (sugar kinase/HSP70/actin superfamily)
MRISSHQCVKRQIPATHPLAGKIVHVPAMAEGSVQAFCAALGWLGIEAHPTPSSDARTLELGGKHTAGDECYPAKVTVGDFVKVLEQPETDPQKTVFMMATGNGPCRFGQYAPYLKMLLRDLGYSQVQIFSPSTQRGYAEVADLGTPFLRAAWRALLGADILRKVLLQTRPFETVSGETDKAFWQSVEDYCSTLRDSCADATCQLKALTDSLVRARDRFRQVSVHRNPDAPLIGVVGEIFCRLNTFTNEQMVRRLEEHGAECWLSDIAEWITYTNLEEIRHLHLEEKTISWDMLRSKLRNKIQRSDEHALLAPFHEDFTARPEPDVAELLELARPYLPHTGAEGEMVLSVGKAAYLALQGADGIVDINPFTCMNGIVSEAIYPRLSRDYGGIPIRSFYFDGTQRDLDRDVGIYLELARSYREKRQAATAVNLARAV